MAQVLVIEDSPVTAKLLAYHLNKIGHHALTAHSGLEGMQILANENVDLVILDYQLPDTDGLALLRRIRAYRPEQLVVMVTGQGDEKLAADVIKAGAKDYVVKDGAYQEPLTVVVEHVLKDEHNRRAYEEQAHQSERMEAQNALTYWMGHNFKNMLSGVLGFLDLIDLRSSRQPVEKREEFLEEAKDGVIRAMDLIDQLISLTQLEPSPSMEVPLAPLIQDAVDKVRRDLAGLAMGSGFELETRVPASMVVRICPKETRLILEHLIRNAAESLEGPGRITVAAEKTRTRLTLVISDTGRGMEEATRKKAFEPLYSTKGEVGVGLGLSMVQAALRRQGGTIKLDSIPGRGTTVTLTWVLAER